LGLQNLRIEGWRQHAARLRAGGGAVAAGAEHAEQPDDDAVPPPEPDRL
jgi:hypothetical protein